MTKIRVLVVDDDANLRELLVELLVMEGFHVTEAASVNSALQWITTTPFDVLVSDLHMPGAADGVTVISAMRHANPRAVTILLSAFPEMYKAARTILAQADQILVKPLDIKILAVTIRHWLAHTSPLFPPIETVATILDISFEQTLDSWYGRVEQDYELMTVPLSREERTEVISEVLLGLIRRLRSQKGLRSNQPGADTERPALSESHHGERRRAQGYSAAMMANESRMLQSSIFDTLDANMDHFDFSLLMGSVMTIADELSSELAQAMKSYLNPYALDQLSR